jgi:hypothetical protein
MHLRSIFQTMRSFAGWGRYLSTGTLKRIPIEWITNEFAFSFAPQGWNYFRAIVAEYEKDPNIDLERSTFFRFFQDERVKSVRYLNDVLFLHDAQRRARGFKFYLGTYPWSDHVGGGPWGHHYDSLAGKNSRDIYGYRNNIWYQPGDKHPIELEWKKTIRMYDSLKSCRYRPFRHRDLPEVTLLVRCDGAIRAVRYNGQHRLSILSQLGHKKVTALVPSARSINAELVTWPTFSDLPKVVYQNEIVVRETDVEHWHYVKHGLCTADEALEIFRAFFELNGRERITYLGIPNVY